MFSVAVFQIAVYMMNVKTFLFILLCPWHPAGTVSSPHDELTTYFSHPRASLRDVKSHLIYSLRKGSAECIFNRVHSHTTAKTNTTKTLYCGAIDMVSRSTDIFYSLTVHHKFHIKGIIVEFETAWSGVNCPQVGMRWTELAKQAHVFCGRRLPWNIASTANTVEVNLYGSVAYFQFSHIKFKLFYFMCRAKCLMPSEKEVVFCNSKLSNSITVERVTKFLALHIYTPVQYVLYLIVSVNNSTSPPMTLYDGPGHLAPVVTLQEYVYNSELTATGRQYTMTFFSSNAFVVLSDDTQPSIHYYSKFRKSLTKHDNSLKNRLAFSARSHSILKSRDDMVHIRRFDITYAKIGSYTQEFHYNHEILKFTLVGPTAVNSESANACQYGGLFIIELYADQTLEMKSEWCNNIGEYRTPRNSYPLNSSIIILSLFIPGYTSGLFSVRFHNAYEGDTHIHWTDTYSLIRPCNHIVHISSSNLLQLGGNDWKYSIMADNAYFFGPSVVLFTYSHIVKDLRYSDHIVLTIYNIDRLYRSSVTKTDYTLGAASIQRRQIMFSCLQNITILNRYVDTRWHLKIKLLRSVRDVRKRYFLAQQYNTTFFPNLEMQHNRKTMTLSKTITILYSEIYHADALLKIHFTSSFDDNKPVRIVVDELSQTFDMHRTSIILRQGESIKLLPVMKTQMINITVEIENNCCLITLSNLDYKSYEAQTVSNAREKRTVFRSARYVCHPNIEIKLTHRCRNVDLDITSCQRPVLDGTCTLFRVCVYAST